MRSSVQIGVGGLAACLALFAAGCSTVDSAALDDEPGSTVEGGMSNEGGGASAPDAAADAMVDAGPVAPVDAGGPDASDVIDAEVDAGATGPACPDGTADCNGKAKDGCETHLRTDEQNCGACNATCDIAHASEICDDGECRVVSCEALWADCDGAALACGTSLTTLADCGECGDTCSGLANATATCATGTCAVAACLGTYGNCDGNASTGCETPLQTITDCGACDNDCMQPGVASATCTALSCVITGCSANNQDCDLDPSNGCELDLMTELCPYRQTLTIDNSDGPALTNHQVRLLLSGSTPTAPAGETCGSLQTHAGHGYYLCTSEQDWATAQNKCRGAGMELVRIDNVAENTFVDDLVTESVWLGATDASTEGKWDWISADAGQFWNGTNLGNATCANGNACAYGITGGLYNHWLAGQPNAGAAADDCARFLPTPSSGADWDDTDCTTTPHDYVCEADLGDVSADFWAKVASDGSDIRAYDDAGTALSYWIEAWDHPSQKAVLWIKVPTIAAYAETTVSLRYGAGGAATSSIGNAMVWGDDFSGVTIDVAKWNTSTADTASIWSITGGELKATNTGTTTTGRLRSLATFTQSSPFVMETQFRVVTQAANGSMAIGSWLTTLNHLGIQTTATVADKIFNDGVTPVLSPGTALATSTRAGFAVMGNGNAFAFNRPATDATITYGTPLANVVLGEPVALGRRYDNNAAFDNQVMDLRWDWILVRSYASPDPQVVLNDDEGGGPP